jgi:hypothetical protein
MPSRDSLSWPPVKRTELLSLSKLRSGVHLMKQRGVQNVYQLGQL